MSHGERSCGTFARARAGARRPASSFGEDASMNAESKGAIRSEIGSALRARSIPAVWLVVAVVATVRSEDPAPAELPSVGLAVADLDRGAPVSFGREILPVLRANCLACHSASKARGGLSLETRESMLEGGDSGAAIVPGRSADSLLFRLATHREEPEMPPANNKAGARSLDPRELALIRAWIDEGATVDVAASTSAVEWQAVPAHYHPILAVGISADGRVVACGRGNDVDVIDLERKDAPERLVDPALSRFEPRAETPGAHLDLVQSIALGADGRVLASGAYRVVKIWRRGLVPMSGNSDGARIEEAAPDGRFLATVAADGRVAVSRIDAGTAIGSESTISFAHGAPVSSLVWSQDGSLLVTASEDGEIRATALPGGETRVQIFAAEAVTSLRVDAATSRVLAAFGSREIAVALEGFSAALPPSSAPTEPATAPGPDASAIVRFERAEDGTVRLLPGEKSPIVIDAGGPVSRAELGPGGVVLAVAVGARVRVFDGATGEKLADAGDDARLAIERAEAERRVATFTGRRDRAKNRDAEAQKSLSDKSTALETARGEVSTALAALETARTTLASVSDGQKEEAVKAEKAARDAHEAATRKVEDAATEVEIAKREAALRAGGLRVAEEDFGSVDEARVRTTVEAETAAGEIVAFVFSPDGNHLAVGRATGLVQVFEARSGVFVDSRRAPGFAIERLTWTGSRLTAHGAEGRAKSWRWQPNWALERVIGDPMGPSPFVDRVLALDVSPDGSLLATGGGDPSRSGELVVLRIDTGEVVFTSSEAHSDTILAVRFSPCGRYIATAAADRMARVFRVSDGGLVAAYEGHSGHVVDVTWLASGETLVTAGADSSVKVWDVETREVRRTVGGFGKQVTAVRAVGDGDRFYSASGDRNVRLHEASSGNQVRGYGGSPDFIYALATTPDGRRVVAGGFDGVLRVWNGENAQIEAELTPLSPKAP
jgi:WD40 repeat protein